MPKRLKDFLIALTLANLCFLSAWRTLLNPLHYSYYHWKIYPGFNEYLALLINVFLLTAVFWGVTAVARWSGKRFLVWMVRWAFLLALIIPFNDLRLQFFGTSSSGIISKLGSALSLLPFLFILLAIAVKRWRMAVFRIAVALMLIVSPFTLITFVQGAWLAYKFRHHAALAQDRPAIPLNSSKKPASRVIWMVFDELDQRLAFSQRPAGLELPELDRLRHQAIFAGNAYSPASHTLQAMPSLIIGRKVSKAVQVRPDELMIRLADGKEVGWSTQPNLFSSARAAGFDTAIVGWYHPYCRVLGSNLSSCFWEPVVDEISPLRGEPTVLKSMSHWASMFLFRIPGVFRLLKSNYDSGRSRDHIEEHLHIMEHAKAALVTREFSLTLLHFPIPHHPFIYDRAQNSLSSRPDNNYLDNLALTDRVFGEMRRDLELAGMWNDTTIIVTADHSWRVPPDGKVDERIPFIIKLAGQKEGKSYEGDCNTLLTSRFIMAVMNGEVTNAEAAVGWLDLNCSENQAGVTKISSSP